MLGTPSIRLELTVGEVARRSGVPVSALHFYEAEGLIRSRRSAGNQRRFPRGILRRVAIIKVAQRAGVSLKEIKEALAQLPQDRLPTPEDWAQMSASWRDALDIRIRNLTAIRDQLTTCIGCGCLSLSVCPLRNPGDQLGLTGSGARLIETP
ncbi:MAG: redox-sensitive transcriptional activator SoxR [Sphingomonas sp.]|nr:redox-sensitive transcriptional activator SoxR [Sphingomonas sp.]